MSDDIVQCSLCFYKNVGLVDFRTFLIILIDKPMTEVGAMRDTEHWAN